MLTALKTHALRVLYRRPVLVMLLALAAFWSSAGALLWKAFA